MSMKSQSLVLASLSLLVSIAVTAQDTASESAQAGDETRLQERFNQLDTDGDGYLSFAEFSAGFMGQQQGQRQRQGQGAAGAARERMQNMTPEQREQMRERMQNLTPEQRARMREQMQGQGQGRNQSQSGAPDPHADH